MIDEKSAYITCVCGEKFQFLKTTGENGEIEWDEEATQATYYDHLQICTASTDNPPAVKEIAASGGNAFTRLLNTIRGQ